MNQEDRVAAEIQARLDEDPRLMAIVTDFTQRYAPADRALFGRRLDCILRYCFAFGAKHAGEQFEGMAKDVQAFIAKLPGVIK